MAKTTAKAAPAADLGGKSLTSLDVAATEVGAESILMTNFTVIEQDALTLMQAASQLVAAQTAEAVSLALDTNLKIWIAIKTVIQNPDNALPAEVKDNLRTLAQYVSGSTMEATGGEIEERRLVALARINMQIAEGLLRGQTRKLIEQRAYEIWVADGRPEGKSMDHWLKAEAEVAKQVEMP